MSASPTGSSGSYDRRPHRPRRTPLSGSRIGHAGASAVSLAVAAAVLLWFVVASVVVGVGDRVLGEAGRQVEGWHQNKGRVPKVSVNISARQFSDGQLGERIASILEDTGLPPACLELELTESILMREVNEAMQILASLKNLGLSIAVDDFGTGYSSLNYLKQFPIDVLKIDRTFVDGLPSGEQDAQIARAIIAMAHSLNLAVIAEGVETHEQLDFLREHGCDEVQGYLFGRPMPPNRFAAQFSNDALFMFD